MLIFDVPQPPISIWYTLTVLGLPGIWLLARTVVFYVSDESERRAVILPGLAVTIWLLSIHIFGLIFQSFGAGLVLGTLVPSLTGLLLRKKGAGRKVGRPNGWLLALALLAPTYLLPTMIRSDFHDKLFLNPSHFSTVNNILNGTYPPRDPIFAHTNLRYHYGVNTLAAVVVTVTRARFDVALDIVSFCGLVYTILALGTLGGALFGPAGRLFAGFLGAFHGGFTWFYPPQGNHSTARLLMGLFHEVNSQWLSSPSTSTLFQMPFSLGYPLFALTLLLALEFDGKTRRLIGSLGILASLATLSFSNITVFLTTSGALFGALGLLLLYYTVRRPSGTRPVFLIPPLIAIASSFVIAAFISGFSEIIFTSGPSVLIKTKGGIAGNLPGSLHWHWGSFGMLIPLAIPGLIFAARLRLFLFIHVVGCLYALNTYRYQHTWDIVKFAFVASISLAILSSGTITWIWRRKLLGKILAFALSATVSASAITYHIPLWRNDPTPFSDSLATGGLGRVRILQDELRAIEWLRLHASRDEIVLRVMDAANLYTSLGGLPIIQPNHFTPQLGYSTDEITRRRDLTSNFSSNISDYKREGVKWIVIHTDPAAGDPYVPRVAAWVRNGECMLAVTFGDFQIYKVN